LQVIESAPDAAQSGDYLLMKARILDAQGETAEARRLLHEGLSHSTVRPDVARQAALLLIRAGDNSEALQLLSRAERSAPGDPDLLLMKGIVVGLTGRYAECEKTLRELEARWPEWARIYTVHALVLECQARTTEARQKIQNRHRTKFA
jgi:Flp pilus assembly protein TadD